MSSILGNGTTAEPTASPLPSPTGSTILPVTDTIPPDHPYRTLVLCFDGTGDQFDADNSNIVEFFAMLKKDNPAKQLVYYQAGIGTYTVPQIVSPMMSKFSQTLDMAVAWNLDAHIMGGYEFLMQNYCAHDRICIFGFSRGAYTARCLAGMIHKVGLLPTCNHQQIPFAYKMYTQADEVGWQQSNKFKKTFSIDVDIEFLGVWDTVSSVGLIPRRLPFTTSNTVVKTFRHAVALDERRAKFKANLWNKPNETEQLLSITDQAIENQAKQKQKQKHAPNGGNGKHHGSLGALERKYTKDRLAATNIDEVWFAGCHCDIGGGSVTNGSKPCLARIPLRWMIRECFRTNSGILFHAEGLKGVGLDPTCLYPVVLSRPPALPLDKSSSETGFLQPIPKAKKSVPNPTDDGDETTALALPVTQEQESEELADLKDSLAPIYDQLTLAWFWWILEIIPMKFHFQNGAHFWEYKLGWNMGKGRHVPKKHHDVRIHRSVKTRMEAEDGKRARYTPKAQIKIDEARVTWVD
ncbi:hypothetical protein GALMADRAFT_74846 [Galerina marginata CBS 339.88]|uniref:T6SS Phospholipase effector Tle1-like catalytic domain-containing protein n=1 Tax=Galerina marginata (strain CBS 339.88) TaxID=685588 RepID=A0A067SNC6_GALM3|nr:hypothetical protein GALMADRAFT_74846 [Galerina marginata CBS 339.88]